MPTLTRTKLTPADAERLLDGGDGPAELRRLLAAATCPGTADELAGEAAAKAAFVTASITAPRTVPLLADAGQRPSVLGTALSKVFAAKALAALALLAGTTSGVAVAASATVGAPDNPPASDVSVDARPSGSNSAGGSGPLVRPTGGAPAGPPIGLPESAVAGLCQAWTAGAGQSAGDNARSPAFTELVAAAGGPDAVAGYCAELPDPPAPGQPAPTTRSDTAPHPPGQPDDVPDRRAEPPARESDSHPGGARVPETPDRPEPAGQPGPPAEQEPERADRDDADDGADDGADEADDDADSNGEATNQR